MHINSSRAPPGFFSACRHLISQVIYFIKSTLDINYITVITTFLERQFLLERRNGHIVSHMCPSPRPSCQCRGYIEVARQFAEWMIFHHKPGNVINRITLGTQRYMPVHHYFVCVYPFGPVSLCCDYLYVCESGHICRNKPL